MLTKSCVVCLVVDRAAAVCMSTSHVLVFGLHVTSMLTLMEISSSLGTGREQICISQLKYVLSSLSNLHVRCLLIEGYGLCLRVILGLLRFWSSLETQLQYKNGCNWAVSQTLEAVSTQRFMVSWGRLSRVEMFLEGAADALCSPCCPRPPSPFLPCAESNKHQLNQLSHPPILLPPCTPYPCLDEMAPPLYPALGMLTPAAFPSPDPRG